ncbi:Uncharacterized protein BM_BM13496 [Brugia malayi]|uniref:Bm13496 n=1 Tax=Brugia malayi TaxID=6279 RepID=A0A0K0IY01_BRUMA|nr:Uncharacterized protein BM_BM13496 [Brugia malayi]CDQ05302.1 Bm13496 [Brugia malayi]VIO96963.1 Uncharacterized protein BM_BM13496 [Brugia malayi]
MSLIYIISLFQITYTRYIGPNFDFSKYHSFEEYENYLESIPQAFPHLAQLQVIGFTHEKRRLLCLKVFIHFKKKKVKKQLIVSITEIG